MQRFDVVIVGAGAAGLFCASVAGQRGLKVLLLDHNRKVAEKIRISGGGRCNFTNRDTTAANFLSDNPRFCRSALSRYSPQDFMALLQRHGIAFHEKHKGQMFCDRSAQDLITMLQAECAQGGVQHQQPCSVQEVRTEGDAYVLSTDMGEVTAPAVVIATGGLSIPKIGATDFGYRIARQFGIPLVPTRPALVPLVFAPEQWAPYVPLAGLSLPVQVQTVPPKGDRGDKGSKGAEGHKMGFHEDLLFTHRGLSGPAVLQISSYWTPGGTLRLDLAPGHDMAALLLEAKLQSRKTLPNTLAQWVPARLAEAWVQQGTAQGHDGSRPIQDTPDKVLHALATQFARWELAPSGTEGYAKAEVTAGGVDTRSLSGQTLESRQRGLYFIGEVVDVTGWLGGYNFQWAWASAWACAHALEPATAPS